MEFHFKPKSKLEKFGQKVSDLLVENSYPTYYVGGMVRDTLLNRKITDIDLATAAHPEQVVRIFTQACITHDASSKRFGIVKALEGNSFVEVTTLREDRPSSDRYPKVRFITNIVQDSNRRDFTINSLYLSQKNNKILDYHKGAADIKKKKIRFIGEPTKRIKEDPLRILRAIRFALDLKFKLEPRTKRAIINNFELLNTLTSSKINSEVMKFSDGKMRLKFKKLIENKYLLTSI